MRTSAASTTWAAAPAWAVSPGGGGAGFDFNDIFDMFAGASGMRGRGQGPVPRQRRGGDVLRRVKIDLRDVVFGTEEEVSFRTAVLCERCTGSCCEPGTSPTRCTACNGSGHVQRVAQSLLGQMVTMAPCPTCEGHHGRRHREPLHRMLGPRPHRLRAHRHRADPLRCGERSNTWLRTSFSYVLLR